VVRTFAMPLSEEQRDRLLAALMVLCGRPLEHPSIARPLACGVEGGRPYLVHAYLPGESLAELAGHAGAVEPADISVRLTYLAGALDFAAAAGVLHGALSPHDVIFSAQNAGVSGFGLVQALESAGIPGFHAEREDDVAGLVAIARTLMGDDIPPAIGAVLSGPPPRTALAFAAALQSTLPLAAPVATPAIEELFHRESFSPAAGQLDIPLLDEDIPLRDLGTTPRADVTPLRAEDEEADIPELALPRPAALAPEAGEIEPLIGDRLIGDRPMFGATNMDVAPVAVPVRPHSSRWLVTAVMALALGIVFAGGFFIGRDAPLPGDTVTTPAPPAPEPTNGQNFTDAAVDEPKPPAVTPPSTAGVTTQPATSSGGARAPAPPKTAPGPSAAARTSTAGPASPAASGSTDASARSAASRDDTDRPASSQPSPRASRAQTAPEPPTGPAAMRVDSRPVGAQVFVDGRSVGYTPMVVGDLNPGTHSVRMQLPGYRPWETAVTLGPGARERVAASLEQ